MIPLSPLHGIELDETYQYLLKRPTENDFPLHTIARKLGPDGRELMHMELVIAGRKTLDAYPEAQKYPIHFLKSYHPWSLHGDPQVEFDLTKEAAELLGSPPPIGCDKRSFRSCFIPGKPLSKISPFTDIEPPERCLGLARETPPASLIGLWKVLEEIFAQLEKLHAHRFFHGDLELHNVIVCTSPIEPFLIDYESSVVLEASDHEGLAAKRFRDLEQVLRLALFLQAGLGDQQGRLAEASREFLPRLMRSPESVQARIDDARRRGAAAPGQAG